MKVKKRRKFYSIRLLVLSNMLSWIDILAKYGGFNPIKNLKFQAEMTLRGRLKKENAQKWKENFSIVAGA